MKVWFCADRTARSIRLTLGFLAGATLLAWSPLPALALSQLPGQAGCVSEGGSSGNCADGISLAGTFGVALSPNALNLYVASPIGNGVAIFLRNPGTGEVQQFDGIAACVSETGNGGACADGRALLGARDIAVATGTIGTCAQGTALLGARGVVVSPNGKNVYVAGRDSDAVVAFARDTRTGALTQLAGTAGCTSETGSLGLCVNGVGLDLPTSIAISKDGRNAYVASVGSHGVAVFSRDRITGALTQLAGTAGCVTEDGSGGLCAKGKAMLGAFSVVVSRNGKNVYVAGRDSNAIAVLSRNRKTGALTQLAGTAGCISEDGSGGQCADGRALVGPVSLAISRNGKDVYATSEISNAVVTFQRAKTGVLTQPVGAAGCVSESGTSGECGDGKALVEARSVAVTRTGKGVYVGSSTSDAVAAFEKD